MPNQLWHSTAGQGPTPFAERSATLYSRTRCWVNAAGLVTVAAISALQRWPGGMVVVALAAFAAIHAYFRRDPHGNSRHYLLVDTTVMGLAMTLIGIPTVAAVMAIVMTFYAALLLDGRQTALVFVYVLAWAGVAWVVDILRVEPTVPATYPTPWIVSTTAFAVVFVLVLSRAVVELISRLESGRTELLAGVAHDLRTPLTVVTGAAAVLRRARADLTEQDAVDLIDMIMSRAAEANRMVGDLLTAGRLSAASLDLEIQTVDVGLLIEETVAVMSTGTAAHDIEVALPDRPFLASADPMRLRQIIQNLLSNALRYGRDHIEVRVEGRDEALVVQVIDNGSGVAADERETIFDPFTRESGAKRHESATGLGLFVARRLARSMEGDLTYDRVDGRSVFELTIPPAQALSSGQSEHTEVVDTGLAEVWLGDDGIVRVSYRPGSGVDTLEHGKVVVEAVAKCLDGEKRPLLVVTRGHHPDADTKKLYAETMPAMVSAVGIAVIGAPIPTGIANLFVSKICQEIPIRVFNSEARGITWLLDRSGGGVDRSAHHIGPLVDT